MTRALARPDPNSISMKDFLFIPVLLGFMLAFTLTLAAIGASEAKVPTPKGVVRAALPSASAEVK